MVGSLVKKTLANNNFFEELKLLKSKKERIDQAIEDTANDYLEENPIVFNSHQVFERVKQRTTDKVSKRRVAFILKNKFGLTYRKLKRIDLLANTAKKIVLRHQFGKLMIDLLSQGKRVINIDETWISEKDYRRMCWRQRYVSNTIGTPAVNPRITFMVAIDTEGSVFFALS